MQKVGQRDKHEHKRKDLHIWKLKAKAMQRQKKNHEKMQRQNINQIKHKDEIQILNTITKYKGVHLHRTVDKIAPIWARRCRTGAWGGWWYAGKRSALVLWLWQNLMLLKLATLQPKMHHQGSIPQNNSTEYQSQLSTVLKWLQLEMGKLF